jgi:hypothetical protein
VSLAAEERKTDNVIIIDKEYNVEDESIVEYFILRDELDLSHYDYDYGCYHD